MGAVVNNVFNFCQLKLKNQHKYDERTNYGLQYNIDFEKIVGTEKILKHPVDLFIQNILIKQIQLTLKF